MSNIEENDEDEGYADAELACQLKRPYHMSISLTPILLKLMVGLLIIGCTSSIYIYSFASAASYKYQFTNFFQAYCNNKRFSVLMVVSLNYLRELLVNSRIYFRGLEPINYSIGYLKREHSFIQSLEYVRFLTIRSWSSMSCWGKIRQMTY